MRYSVRWLPEAEDALARIWMECSDPNAVTQASHEVDQILSVAPQTSGQEFYGDWLLEVSPLYVVYTFSTEDLLVRVLHLWHK